MHYFRRTFENYDIILEITEISDNDVIDNIPSLSEISVYQAIYNTTFYNRLSRSVISASVIV